LNISTSLCSPRFHRPSRSHRNSYHPRTQPTKGPARRCLCTQQPQTRGSRLPLPQGPRLLFGTNRANARRLAPHMDKLMARKQTLPRKSHPMLTRENIISATETTTTVVAQDLNKETVLRFRHW